jgi:hypothetical protein
MEKFNFFTMLVAALLTLGVASCNKGEMDAGETEPGQPTVMELTIYSPLALQTYAADDLYATDAEIEMKKVNVLIYAQSSIPDVYILEQNAELDRTDFENTLITPDTYVLKEGEKITTTTGSKKIYVVVNNPGTLPAVGSPLADLSDFTYTHSTDADYLYKTAKGFAMSSVQEESVTLLPETSPGTTPNANKLTINVKRMVAKITVQEKIPRNADDEIELDGGIFTNLQFAVGHLNKSIYAFQKREGNAPGIVVKDPNWSSYTTGDFIGIGDYTLASPKYQSVDVSATATLSLKMAYAPENTAQTYNVDGDNLTYISVRAQYQPEFFSDENGVSKGENTDPAKSFWVVSKSDGSVLYFDLDTEAGTYRDANTGSTMSDEYVDGICYYRAYINKNGAGDTGYKPARFDVLRNNYYKAVIVSIDALGKPTDEGKVTEETSLSMDILVESWVPVSDDYNLF